MNEQPRPGSRTASRFRDESPAMPGMFAGVPNDASRPQRNARSTWTLLRALPLTLGVVAGIVIVVVGISLFSHKPGSSGAASNPSVAPTARQICDDLTTQRYADLFGLLAPAEQALGPSTQFIASQQQLDAQLGATHTCTYTVAGQDATNATLTLTLTRGTQSATPAQMRLVLQSGAWRIADYDTSLVAAPGGQFQRERSSSNGG